MNIFHWLLWRTSLVIIGVGVVFWILPQESPLKAAITWQRLASPGQLSAAHAFLENNCAACHTAVKGAEAINCIACHANNASLLQRQPTAFHASLSSCQECHIEHQGVNRRPTIMDHTVLTKIGLRQLKADARPDNDNNRLYAQLVSWINQDVASLESLSLSRQEAALQCVTCHRNEDRHFSLFGQDCGQCHATVKWTIATFRHPSPRSQDCAQCHQAPPSHYMEHFRMISMKVAGKPHARVNQCQVCHQTTSWPDIKDVGWYKHH